MAMTVWGQSHEMSYKEPKVTSGTAGLFNPNLQLFVCQETDGGGKQRVSSPNKQYFNKLLLQYLTHMFSTSSLGDEISRTVHFNGVYLMWASSLPGNKQD